MTSTYKAECNRRNGLKSTGPKTVEGKNRVRLNALKHGMSAQTAVLPDEDSEAFARQRDALMADLKPRDEVERALAETIVLARWKRQRCERAEIGMIAQRMQHAELEEAVKEHHEVISLGRRLFSDRRGDARLYPHGFLECSHDPRSSYAPGPEDPDDPAHILIDLESTITGCRWLLARWAELKDRLSEGLAWHSQDKLKAIRTLGKQPLEAPDDPVVCLIYVASHVADPRFGSPFYELELEFEYESQDYVNFMNRLKERPWKALRPKDQAEARQELAEVADKATARLEKIIAAHERRAAHYGEKSVHRLAFDASDDAERLRRHERACVRDMFRSLSTLAKLRQGELLDDGEPWTADGQGYQPGGPASRPEEGETPLVQGEEDQSVFQNKPNAHCNGEAEYTGQSDKSAGPEPQCPQPTAQTGFTLAEGRSPEPVDLALHVTSVAFPLVSAVDAGVDYFGPGELARAADALQKRRKAERLQRKRWREENRRENAERLRRKGEREQAQRGPP